MGCRSSVKKLEIAHNHMEVVAGRQPAIPRHLIRELKFRRDGAAPAIDFDGLQRHRFEISGHSDDALPNREVQRRRGLVTEFFRHAVREKREVLVQYQFSLGNPAQIAIGLGSIQRAKQHAHEQVQQRGLADAIDAGENRDASREINVESSVVLPRVQRVVANTQPDDNRQLDLGLHKISLNDCYPHHPMRSISVLHRACAFLYAICHAS